MAKVVADMGAGPLGEERQAVVGQQERRTGEPAWMASAPAWVWSIALATSIAE